jgi:hypothetical protein
MLQVGCVLQGREASKKVFNLEGRSRRQKPESRCKCNAHIIMKLEISCGFGLLGGLTNITIISLLDWTESSFFDLRERSMTYRNLRS